MHKKPTWTVYLVVLSCLWAIGIQCCHAPFGWAEAAAEAVSDCHATAQTPTGDTSEPEHGDDCHCHQWVAVPALPSLNVLSTDATGLDVPLLDGLLNPLVAFLPAHWQPLQPVPPPWPEPPPLRPTTGLQIVETTYLLI